MQSFPWEVTDITRQAEKSSQAALKKGNPETDFVPRPLTWWTSWSSRYVPFSSFCRWQILQGLCTRGVNDLLRVIQPESIELKFDTSENPRSLYPWPPTGKAQFRKQTNKQKIEYTKYTTTFGSNSILLFSSPAEQNRTHLSSKVRNVPCSVYCVCHLLAIPRPSRAWHA